MERCQVDILRCRVTGASAMPVVRGPVDLARFAIAIQKALTGKQENLITQAMAKEMITPQTGGWGLGPEIKGKGGDLRFQHAGSNMGFKSVLVAYADRGQGVAIMSNSDNGFELISEIVRSVASAYNWPDYRPKEKSLAKVDPKIYAELQGTYYNEKADSPFALQAIEVVIQKDRLVAVPSNGGIPLVLYPESEIDYFVMENELKYTFVKNAEGEFDELDISSDLPPPMIFKKRKT